MAKIVDVVTDRVRLRAGPTENDAVDLLMVLTSAGDLPHLAEVRVERGGVHRVVDRHPSSGMGVAGVGSSGVADHPPARAYECQVWVSIP